MVFQTHITCPPNHCSIITLQFKQVVDIGARGVVVSMFDFHRSDRGSNPGRGGEFS